MRDRYFGWLREQLDSLESGDTYSLLFNTLYSLEYVPLLMMDQNREHDALEMRKQVCGILHTRPSHAPCSFLEFLAALSFRMHYICDAPNEWRVKEFFWRLLSNLGLNLFRNDTWSLGDEERIKDIVTRVNQRTFDSDGAGGLFPMAAPKQNQRNLEVWYQMNQYIQDPNGRDLMVL